MSTAVRWLRQNRYAAAGALMGGALIGLIGAPFALGGGVIGFATGHYLDGRLDPSALTSIVGDAPHRSTAVV